MGKFGFPATTAQGFHIPLVMFQMQTLDLRFKLETLQLGIGKIKPLLAMEAPITTSILCATFMVPARNQG
jgi:hypothetical protein